MFWLTLKFLAAMLLSSMVIAFDDACLHLMPAANYDASRFGQGLWYPYKSTYASLDEKCLAQLLFIETKKLVIITGSQKKLNDEVQYQSLGYTLGEIPGVFIHRNGARGIVLKTDNENYYVYLACLVEGQDESSRRVKYSIKGDKPTPEALAAFNEAAQEIRSLGIVAPETLIDRTNCKAFELKDFL